MKKIYMILLVAFIAVRVSAQVTVTFQVDLTDYIKAGNALTTVKIAGNFAALTAKAGTTPLSDWAPPSSPVFTNQGNNIWSTKIIFPNISKGQDLFFKFLNTADTWGACGKEQECMGDATTACSNKPADDNRKLTIPTAATTICFKWETCTSCGSTGVKDLLLDTNVAITPNPANQNALVTIEGQDVYSIDITNPIGQVVGTMKNVVNQAVIERGDLAAGLYYVVIRNAEGKSKTQKLIFE